MESAVCRPNGKAGGYEGDYVLSESDLHAGRVFDDEIAYGGWPMDDHDPRGFATADPPNRNIRMAAPYAIPYRCLYSRNTDNLWFAGRNVSVTHMALSSTRVMATCALMGQAVGTACAVAVRHGCDPRGVGGHMSELQQMLREDDCYLLHTPRRPSAALAAAACDHSLAGMRAGHRTPAVGRRSVGDARPRGAVHDDLSGRVRAGPCGCF